MPSFFTRLRNLFHSDEPFRAAESPCPGRLIHEDERARRAAPRTDLPDATTPFRRSYQSPADRFDGPRSFGDGPPPSSSFRQNAPSRDESGGPGRYF